MHALPGLAILLLATIGAARVVKVSLVGARRAWRAFRALLGHALARKPRPAIDADALVKALAELIERRAARRNALCDVREPAASDTVIDMPRQRRS